MKGFHLYVVPVLVAAAVQWVIGAIWYGMVFRKRWMTLTGTGENKGGGAAFGMICSFVGSVILCFVLVNLMAGARMDFTSGAALAIVCWLGFMAPPLFVQHIYERRPVNLFAINAGYWVVAMAIAGGVLAVMPK